MRRPFIFVFTPLLLGVAACTSNSTLREAPSILDVVEQSNQSPTRSPNANGSCPGGSVNVCLAETRTLNPTRCSCIDNTEVMSLFRRPF